MTDSTELLNPADASKALGIRVSTIRAWVLNRKIPYVKLGGKLVKFRRVDIEKFIAARVVPAQRQVVSRG
jgi:excisionase family DNA binding protein